MIYGLNFKGAVEASCDGWGEAVEYSRTGFNRSDVFEKLIKGNKFVNRINCVVNIYSVWTLPYIEKICKFGLTSNLFTRPAFCQTFKSSRLLREDKNELRKIYSPYPRLLQVYNDYINKDIAPQGKVYD